MRGVTLDELVRRLRVQLSHSVNVAHGSATEEHLKEHLRLAQDWLWEKYDWEHLDVSRDVVLEAGTRYYALPADMTEERINRVTFKDGSEWIALEYGIEPEHFSCYDSDNGATSWPVCRWRTAEEPNPVPEGLEDRQWIEVWPVPSNTGDSQTKWGCLRLRGIRKMAPLVDGDDKCEIDGNLIVMHAAIRLVARQSQKDAERLAGEADALRMRLQGNGTAKKRRHNFAPDEPTGSFTDRRFAYVRR